MPVSASPAEALGVDGHVLDDGEDGEGESLDEGVAVLLLQLRRTLPREALIEVHVHRLKVRAAAASLRACMRNR